MNIMRPKIGRRFFNVRNSFLSQLRCSVKNETPVMLLILEKLQMSLRLFSSSVRSVRSVRSVHHRMMC